MIVDNGIDDLGIADPGWRLDWSGGKYFVGLERRKAMAEGTRLIISIVCLSKAL